MLVALATDHAGFSHKELLKTFLDEKGIEYIDFGAKSYNKDDDYPDFVKPAAELLNKKKCDFAIIFGASGQGEAIVANRYKNVRAVVLNNENMEIVKLAREHNDANVLSIGASFVSSDFVMNAVSNFLNTNFTKEERHTRRISKIN